MAGYLVPPAVSPGNVLTSAGWNLLRDDLDFGMVRPIADTILGAPAASIDFPSIPATFAQLMLVLQGRGDVAAVTAGVLLRFNNDSAANYDYQALSSNTTAVVASEGLAATSISCALVAAGSAAAGLFGGLEIDIPNYAGAVANKNLTARWSCKRGVASTDMIVGLHSGFWRSSAAINRITILLTSGNFVAGTRATLYGMGGI